MMQRSIDITLSILASVAAILLSWPYARNFEYWPESPQMWQVYFALGFVLAAYVFYVFLGSLRTLFEHDALEHAAAAKNQGDRS
jgi:drug/metabolite transporter (DMT)-like permease